MMLPTELDRKLHFLTLAACAATASAMFIAVMFRYEIVSAPAGGQGVHGIVYRLDRWTGDVTWMQAGIGGKAGIKQE
ncbi:MAG: hypothetical protein V4631_21020 [Pseudomonadota bacterium]